MAAFWSEAALMTTSGLLVMAVAVPVGLLARALRPRDEPLLPRWKPWRGPWGGFEVFVAFLILSPMLLPPVVLQVLTDGGFYQAVYGPDFPTPGAKDVTPERLDEANMVRSLWAGFFALPLQLAMLWGAIRALHPTWKPAIIGQGSFAGKVWLAVLAWLVLTPVVLVFNAAVNTLSEQLGVPPDKHPLTKFGASAPLEQALFLFRACVVAPVVEEVFFRGLLLSWCVGRTNFLGGAGTSPSTGARPWFVMAVAVVLAAMLGEWRTGPLVFAGLLAVGLGILWRFQRTGARRARAVYATAVLFAVVHSGVWPNPVPLFVLALGLGWLAVRTNGVLVPVIVHGLFNAVAAVFVLRT